MNAQNPHTRRRFLKTTAATGAVLGLSDLSGFLPLSPLHAAEAAVTPDLVRLRPEIEPLVKLIDATPREECIPLLVKKLQDGVPYRELLAAVFLVATGRGSHHSVYLVHAAHRMSLDLRPEERLVPLLWAVDVIKEHQGRFEHKLLPPMKGNLPPAAVAAAEFDDAMGKWDRERAERALIAVARNEGARPTMERLWHYAARDWSFIGHFAIAVANCARTLETIGWQHAEPVLRYLVYHLHDWNKNKTAGQPYAASLERAENGLPKLAPDWASAASDDKAVIELFEIIRKGKWQPSCAWVYQQLTVGNVHAGTVWDAVHLATADFMIRFSLGGRRLGNRALHSNTSANALHYAFRTCRDPQTRLFILFQAVAWAADFIGVETGRGMMRDLSIVAMPAVDVPASADKAIDAIFSRLPPRAFLAEIEDRSAQDEAARLAFAFAQQNPDRALFLQTARHFVCTKTTLNAHDLKFPAAIFEDLHWVSPQWQPHLIAASTHFLHGTQAPDAPFLQSARDVLGV